MGARGWRITILLLVLAVVGLRYSQIRRAERWVPTWEKNEHISVILLVPRGAEAADRALLGQLREYAILGSNKATFWALKDWFDAEFQRYVDGRKGFSPVFLNVVGPHEVEGPPPAPPRASEALSFLERWERSRAFLGWFDPLRARWAGRTPNVIYVYFYPASEREHFAEIHSVAERRTHSGFVFVPLTAWGLEQALTNVAHEALHLFGATDKYDGERCVYPEGYFEPFLPDRHRQRYAEVMAMGFPTAAGREHALELFEHMRVGVATAQEVGWIDVARRQRYYGGDASAGGREE